MKNKLITLYKYVPLEYLEETIRNQRLYLNDGRNLNDPFELLVTDKVNKTNRFIDGLHILCLTNNYRNKLIWSHYAESHRGACLTIKVPRKIVRSVVYTTKRIYEDSDIDEILKIGMKGRPKKSRDDDYSSLSLNEKIAYVKDKKWAYEKEFRIVFGSKDENELIHEDGKWFLKVKITNIYLGINFDYKKEGNENILKLCEKENIKITRMILSEDHYALNVDNRKETRK